jgi:hypothetical protein
MLTTESPPGALRALTHDGWLLFLARFIRLFAYGSLSVVLVLYLIVSLTGASVAPSFSVSDFSDGISVCSLAGIWLPHQERWFE